MKTFRQLNIGDYIYHTSDQIPMTWHVYRITDVIEMEDEFIFKTSWFGQYKYSSRDIHIPNESLDSDFIIEDYINEFKYTTHVNCGTTSIGKYIYNKAHNNKDFEHCEYELVQEHLLGKSIIHSEQIYGPDSFDVDFIDTYEWDRNSKFVLYKARYENQDGPFFFRHEKDFYNNFTKIG